MAQTSTYSLDMGGGGNAVTNISAPVQSSPATAVLWVKPASLGTIVLCGQGSHWRLQLTGGGAIRVNDGTADNDFPTLTVSTGSWTAIAVKWTGTAAACRIRPSGGSVSSATMTLANAIAAGGASFGIGDYAFGLFTMTGKCDQVQLYGSALADATIDALLDGSGDPASSTPVLWWKLEEGSGTTTADQSGNGYTGTISGPTWSPDVPAELAGSSAPVPNRFVSLNQAVKTAVY